MALLRAGALAVGPGLAVSLNPPKSGPPSKNKSKSRGEYRPGGPSRVSRSTSRSISRVALLAPLEPPRGLAGGGSHQRGYRIHPALHDGGAPVHGRAWHSADVILGHFTEKPTLPLCSKPHKQGASSKRRRM